MVAVAKAQKIEVTVPVKKIIFKNWLWGRRPDGVAINEDIQIAYAFTGKRSTNRDEGFLEKEKEANEQQLEKTSSVCSEQLPRREYLSRSTL